MQVFDKDKKLIFETTFPQKNFSRYLKKLGATAKEKLTEEQIEKIFLWAYQDFQKGKLSLDGLADIADYLWTSHLDDSKKFKSLLGEVLLAATELSYNVRFAHKKSAAKELISSLKKIREFKVEVEDGEEK